MSGDDVKDDKEKEDDEEAFLEVFVGVPGDLTDYERIIAVRGYLRCVGKMPESVFCCWYNILVWYLHGRMY